MMNRVIVLLVMVLLLVVSPIMGCSSSGGGVANPIALVPAKANLVAHADVSAILQDKDLTGIYDKLPKDVGNPQTFNDALNELKDKYNIDLMSFQEGVLFADIEPSNDGGNYSGAIVKGTFNKDDLKAAIQANSETVWSTITYKNYDIYSNEVEDTAFTFLADNALVIGTMQPVKDVIDVKKGDAEALSGEVLDAYNQLGNAFIKVAVVVPPRAAEGNLGQSAGQILGNLSAFDKVETAGITVSKSDESVTINVKLCCADTDSAQSVEDSVNGLVGIIGFALSMSEDQEQQQRNQTIINLLDKVEVSRSGSCVNIALTATITEIEDLIQSSGQTI